MGLIAQQPQPAIQPAKPPELGPEWEETPPEEYEKIWPEEARLMGMRAAAQEKEYAVGKGFKTLGRALLRVPEEMAASVMSAIRAGDIDLEKGWSDEFIESTKRRSEAFVKEHGTKNLVAPGITVEDVARLPQQLGYTVTSMLAGLGVGIPTAAVPVPGARALAWTAGTAASGVAAYRMAKDQFVSDLYDLVSQECLKNQKREITENEWDSIREKYEAKARDYGLWEAIPEAIGQAAGLKIIRLPVGKLPILKFLKIPAIRNRFARTLATVGSKYGAMQVGEQAQETVTQYGQAAIEAEAGLRKPVPETRLGRLAQAAKEQYPQTTLLTTVTGGLGAIGSRAYDIGARAKEEAIPTAPEVEEEAPIDLLEALTPEQSGLISKVEKDVKAGALTRPMLERLRAEHFPGDNAVGKEIDRLAATLPEEVIELTEVVGPLTKPAQESARVLEEQLGQAEELRRSEEGRRLLRQQLAEEEARGAEAEEMARYQPLPEEWEEVEAGPTGIRPKAEAEEIAKVPEVVAEEKVPPPSELARVKVEKPEPKAEKQPWEMTREEWFKAKPTQIAVETRKFAGKVVYVTPLDKTKTFKTPEAVLEFEHQRFVQQALSEGKPVPAKILEEYPELKPTAEKEPWEMNIQELQNESAAFDKKIAAETERLNRLHPERQRFGEAGIEHLSPEDARRMVAVNDELNRRTSISVKEARERVAIKRAARKAAAKPYVDLTPGTTEWKRMWRENPELQREMIAYAKERAKIPPRIEEKAKAIPEVRVKEEKPAKAEVSPREAKEISVRPTKGGWYKYTNAKTGEVTTGKIDRVARVRSGAVLAFFEGGKKGFPVTKYGKWEHAKPEMEGPGVTIEEARAKAAEAEMAMRETRRKKAAQQEYLVPWIAAAGGVNPTILSGEIRDIIYTTDARGKKKLVRGIPPGFLRKNGKSLDVVVRDAREQGFDVRDEDHLLELIERDLKSAQENDIKGRITRIPAEPTTEKEFIEGAIEHARQELRNQGYTDKQIARAEKGLDAEISAQTYPDEETTYQELRDYFEEISKPPAKKEPARKALHQSKLIRSRSGVAQIIDETEDRYLTRSLSRQKHESYVLKSEPHEIVDKSELSDSEWLDWQASYLEEKSQKAAPKTAEQVATLMEAEKIRDREPKTVRWQLKEVRGKPARKPSSTLVKILSDQLQDETGAISFAKAKEGTIYDNLVTVGKDFIREGHRKYSDFARRMKSAFANAWEKIRGLMMRVWRDATKLLKEETGAITVKPPETPEEMSAWAAQYVKTALKEIADKEEVAKAGKEYDRKYYRDIPKAEDRPKEPSNFETAKDDWFGNKDWAVQVNSIQCSKIQDAIKDALGKKRYDAEARDIDQAIHIYLDLKRNPEHLEEYYWDLTDEQKRIVDLTRRVAQEPGLRAIAKYISEEYEKTGVRALGNNVIFNTIDNYVARAWKIPKKLSTDVLQKFKTSSRHAKHRVFETILEGQAHGYELLVTGASNNLELLKNEIARTVEDRALVKELRTLEWRDTGEPVISDKQLEGYTGIEHPNFTYWAPVGYIKGGKARTYGRDFRVMTFWGAIKEGNTRATKLFESEEEANLFIQGQDKPGQFRIEERRTIWKRQKLYAPDEVAKQLNKILGVSKLKGRWEIGGISLIDALTKYNAVFKSTILLTSFFHHQAFMRSYLFGTRHKTVYEWNPFRMYKEGLKAIKEMRPEIELLVRNGLTLGRMQDWEESILEEEDTIFGRVLSKSKYGKEFVDWANELRRRQADFLFRNFGAGLKAQAALIEYRNALKEHPEMQPEERAKMVAELVNDDFGGLHLGRMKRDPTMQHLYRLFALAPDWTESNVNTMWKSFKSGDKAKTGLYRRFWASVITKGLTATLLTNFLLSLLDKDDDFTSRFKKAWKAGYFRWLYIDVTPIYKLLGGKTEARKYFNLFGHFTDPLKFIIHPFRSMKNKGSVLFRTIFEAFTGTDWKGQRFTTLDEILGFDDKGLYLTTTKEHKLGERKGGRLRWKTVAPSGRIGWAISPSQVPSYIINQLRGVTPVQVQNFLAMLQGEIDGFDTITRNLGLYTATTYPTKKKMTDEFVEEWVRLKKEGGSFFALKDRIERYNDRQRQLGEKGIPISWSTVAKKGVNIIKSEAASESLKRRATGG
jgi:hypothetical protein